MEEYIVISKCIYMVLGKVTQLQEDDTNLLEFLVNKIGYERRDETTSNRQQLHNTSGDSPRTLSPVC
jgi:hypothetical protein